MRRGRVYNHNQMAGMITETNEGLFEFVYDETYLGSDNATPISLTMPLQKKAFVSDQLFPFFDGLVPEGWLLQIAHQNWKIDANDRMGVLLKVCEDCIGSVHVVGEEAHHDE